MKRLARGWFTLCSAASLLLCMALCVLWVRSYRLTDQLEWRSAGGYRGLGSASGNLVVQLNPGQTQPPASHGLRYLRMSRYTAPTYAVAFGHLGPNRSYGTTEFAGAGWYTVRDATGGRTTTGVAPFWLLAAVTAILPLSHSRSWMRAFTQHRRNASAGLCPSCGYDLRERPERCPECGEPATKATA